MELNWTDFTINFDEFEDEELMNDWSWLIDQELKPILVSSFGDFILMNESGEVFWLAIAEGILEQVADSEKEFKSKIQDDDFLMEIFLPHLILEMKENNLHLEEGQVYGFKQSPLEEGEFEISNLEIKDLLEYNKECAELAKRLS